MRWVGTIGRMSLWVGYCVGLFLSTVEASAMLELDPATRFERPILFVTTDIGGDPDDMQSMRRLLLYSNDVDIRGILASGSGTPGEVGHPVSRPDLVHDILRDYGLVEETLRQHDPGYPTAESLRKVVVAGDPDRRSSSIRAGASSEGSRFLTRVVDEADRPVYVAVWGGARDLAQALVDVRAERSTEELLRFTGKLRVYAIGDQDGYNQHVNGERVDVAGSGKWIKDNFPDLRYVETNPPEINRMSALFRGMYQNESLGGGYAMTPLVRPDVARMNTEEWLQQNVLTHHGALGAGYPMTGQNPRSDLNTRGIKEGDTPSWFFVLPLGLNDPEFPTYGGWGGRFQHAANNHFTDGEDRHWSDQANEATRRKWTVARWREAYQNDFAARMDWCVKGYGEANHPPALRVMEDDTRQILEKAVEPGKWYTLSAASEDPDGDRVDYHWWVYSEVTGFDQNHITLDGVHEPELRLRIHPGGAGQRVHIILEGTDQGMPALTRYRRVILEVAAAAF